MGTDMTLSTLTVRSSVALDMGHHAASADKLQLRSKNFKQSPDSIFEDGYQRGKFRQTPCREIDAANCPSEMIVDSISFRKPHQDTRSKVRKPLCAIQAASETCPRRFYIGGSASDCPAPSADD